MGLRDKLAAVALAGTAMLPGAAQAQANPPGITINENNNDNINNNTAIGEANADVQIEGSLGLALSSMAPSDGSGAANRFLVCEGRGFSTPIISWGRDCQIDPEFTALLMEHEVELASANSAGALLGFLTERYYDIKLQQLENEGQLAVIALAEMLEHGYGDDAIGGDRVDPATMREHILAWASSMGALRGTGVPESNLIAMRIMDEHGYQETETDQLRQDITRAIVAAIESGEIRRETFGEITADYNEFMVQAARTVVFFQLSTGNVERAAAVNNAISEAFAASGIGYVGDDGQTYYGTGLVFPAAEQVHDLNVQP